MSRSCTQPHASGDQDRGASPAGDVVYLVKRPRYELILTIPKARFDGLNGGAFFQVRFRDRQSSQDAVLNDEQLIDFYESLGQLIDYLYIERGKSRGGG